MLVYLYVALGTCLMAAGIGLYLYRRPLEKYDRYLRRTLEGRIFFFSWPGPEKWQEFQEKARSATIRFVVPGFLILLGIILLIDAAS